MATEIQTIKASQLAELTNVTDSNYIVVTDGSVSKKVKATLLKGSSGTGLTTEQINKLNIYNNSARQPRHLRIIHRICVSNK